MKNEVIGKYSKITLLSTLTWAVSNPVLFVFIMSKGLSVAEAGLAFAAYSIARVIFEIPTGAFADAYGRAKSAALSFALLAFGYAVMIFFPGWWVAAGFFLLGVADSFMGGAIDAWAVEGLKKQGEGHLTINLFAQGKIVMLATLIGGSIIGGVIGGVSMPLAMAFGVPFCAYGAYYCLGLPEKKRKKRFRKAEMEILGKMKKALEICRGNANLLALAAILLLIGVATYFLFAFWQPAFKELLGWGPSEFGFLYAAMMAAGILGTKIGERLGARRHVYAVALLGCGVFAFLAGAAWAPFATLALYLMIEIFLGMPGPKEGVILHDNAADSQRATIASVKNLVFRLGFAGGGILFFLFGGGDIAQSWMASGAIFAVAAAIAWKMGF